MNRFVDFVIAACSFAVLVVVYGLAAVGLFLVVVGRVTRWLLELVLR